MLSPDRFQFAIVAPCERESRNARFLAISIDPLLKGRSHQRYTYVRSRWRRVAERERDKEGCPRASPRGPMTPSVWLDHCVAMLVIVASDFKREFGAGYCLGKPIKEATCRGK